MEKQQHEFSPGMWVVHQNYGVGYIEDIEEKVMQQRAGEYFRIETDNSTLWVPTDEADNYLRPIATKQRINDMIEALKRPPKKMNAQFLSRKKRINEVGKSNSPIDLARLVRDLWGRRQKRGRLSNTEETAFQRLTQRLLNEWATSTNQEFEEVESRMYDLLSQERQSALATD